MFMKTRLPLAALALLGLSTTGCLFISSTKTSGPPPMPRVEYRPAPDEGPVDLLTKQIDAASSLSFEQARVDAMQRIARRVPLRPDAQARLVWAAYLRLDFEQNKVAVLRTILQNPSCDDAARGAVLDGLSHLAFEQNRSEMLGLVEQPTP